MSDGALFAKHRYGMNLLRGYTEETAGGVEP